MSRMRFSALSLLWSRTDEETMWEVKTRDDHRAFAQLVARWEGPIHRLCTRMLGDPDRGEDMKQETFARLFVKRSGYEPTGRFSTYLWRLALNVCHDELRRIRRRRELTVVRDEADEEAGPECEDCPAEEASPAELVAGLEEGELVRRAVLRLPEIYRSVLILRHYEGLKIAKIAEILAVPEGTVNSRMAEALTRLTRALEPQFGLGSGRPSGQPMAKRESSVL
jgi:RNA polymerase sigma-70 factor, ECF subfamily